MKGRTIELKVRRFGNSLGIVLPTEVINRLQTTKGAAVFLTEIEGGDYRLTSSNSAFEKKMAAAEEVTQRYRNTLQTLAR
jgi:putative addiction module antidote